MTSGDTLIFLPGDYLLDEGFDLSGLPDTCVYGDGWVLIDGDGKLEYGFKIGSRTTISGIRFKNCKIPVWVVDGADQALVFECFDYETELIEGGRSFLAGAVSGSTFKNVSCERLSEGISAFKGITLSNVVSRARLAFTGEIVDRFDDQVLILPRPPITASQSFRESDFLEGKRSLYVAATNTALTPQTALFRRILQGSEKYDLSRADHLQVLLFGLNGTGIAAGASAIQVTIKSSTGENTYNFVNTAYANGFFLLDVDLLNPDVVVGAIDLSNINEFALSLNLVAGGSVIFQIDHLYLIDSTLTILANGVPNESGYDPMALFRGAEGLDVTATPPPYYNPVFEDYRYDRMSPDYLTYVRGGYNNFPLGAIFQPCHSFTMEDPGHLSLNGHRLLGRWYNDETFFDTENGEPGPQAEGYAASLDEAGAVVTGINAEVVNITVTTDTGDTRDLDDAQATKFDKAAGVETWAGLESAFSPAKATSGDLPIGYSGEFKIPVGALSDLGTDGLELYVTTGSGTITGRRGVADLVEGWNEVTVLIDDPFAFTGTFDPDDILSMETRLSVDPGVAFTGFIADHLKTIVVPGKSTAPVNLTTTGFVIDLTNYPEGQVARAISDPFPIRKAGQILYAFWSAIESADLGGFINRRPFKQQHGTRTIEVRWSEMKFSLYGAVQGALAQIWVPLSRLSPREMPRDLDLLWVQFRVTARNRTNEVE